MNTCALTSVANDAAWPSQTAGRRCRAAAHCATTVNGKHAIPVTNVLFGAAQAPTLDALPPWQRFTAGASEGAAEKLCMGRSGT